MIGRLPSRQNKTASPEPKGFDDFDLRLGDMMRGERATLGKSLLDVQRELKIKAAYIAAIENADPSAFDTPGFIAGYVRSYARYLDMDPDYAFEKFCQESGFATAHGMSAEASSIRKPAREESRGQPAAPRDPFAQPATPFAPGRESLFHRVEPGAIGSSLVLIALIGAIGFGGWTVLKEVQQVKLAPVDQTPVVLSDLDPLSPALRTTAEGDGAASDGGLNAGTSEALNRLYRPQALDVPVLVARDAPISTLDPTTVGSFTQPGAPDTAPRRAEAAPEGDTPVPSVPQVVETGLPSLAVMAVRPAWVRVRAADGTVIFEGIMDAGDTYDIPATEEPPTLRVGASGAVYFSVNGETYGPAGPRGSVTSNLPLSAEHLTTEYALADPASDADLERMVAQLTSDPETASVPEAE